MWRTPELVSSVLRHLEQLGDYVKHVDALNKVVLLLPHACNSGTLHCLYGYRTLYGETPVNECGKCLRYSSNFRQQICMYIISFDELEVRVDKLICNVMMAGV